MGPHAVSGRNEKGEPTVFYFDSEQEKNNFVSAQTRFRQTGSFIIDPLLVPPVPPKRADGVVALAEVASTKKFSSDEEAKSFFTTATRNIVADFPAGKVDQTKVTEFVDNLVAINKEYDGPLKHLMNDRKFELENVMAKAKSAKEVATAQEARDASQKQIDELKKAEEKIAKEKAQQEKEKEKQAQAQEFQRQLEQQALAQAVNQAVNGGGANGKGAGQGSGGNSNSNNNKPTDPPKFDNNQPKHDNLADQLSKALNQNNNNSNLNSLFGNNNSNSSNSGNDKKKEDGFKFDISPKTPKNEVEPVKAAAKLPDSNAAVDPSSSQNSDNGLDNSLSGPTSVPQLMAASASNALNPSFEGGGAGGGGSSSPGKIQGGIPNSGDGGSASEIFSSVGRVDYGELPPPIRKDSAAFGGELAGGEGGAEGSASGGATSFSKRPITLIDELLLNSDNPRAKGRGIMALVGYQVKDFCKQAGANKMGVCQFRKGKTKQEKVSLNQ